MAGNESFFSSKDAIAATMRKVGARFDRDARILSKALPFERYQFVTVRFTTPNEDVKVPHDLEPSEIRDVFYIVARTNRPTLIYDNQYVTTDLSGRGSYYDPILETTIPAIPWTKDYIVLRSTSAPCNVTLLLGLARREDIPSNA